MVLAAVTAVGCGEGADVTDPGQISIADAPVSPEVIGSQYIPVEFDPSVMPQGINTEVAVTSTTVLFYGGQTSTDDGGLVAHGDGALLDLPSGELTKTPPWPHGDAPYAPGVVAVGERFVVLGTPCASAAPTDGDPECPAGARAAVLDPQTGSWEALPAPSDHVDVESNAYATVGALGAIGNVAYFSYSDDPSARATILGYDLEGAQWQHLGAYESAIWDHCATATALVRGKASTDGGLVAERLDPSTGEWRSGDGKTSATSPEPDEGPGVEDVDTSQPTVPRLRCAGDQMVAFTAGDGMPSAMYWFNDDTATWYEVPPPELRQGSYPAGVRSDDVLVLWPTDQAGPVQALSAGMWRTLDDMPTLEGPQLARVGDETVVIGREPGAGRFVVGRLVLEVGSA
jgi:hypothetical protein